MDTPARACEAVSKVWRYVGHRNDTLAELTCPLNFVIRICHPRDFFCAQLPQTIFRISVDILCGEAKHQNPLELVWSKVISASGFDFKACSCSPSF